MSSPGGPQQPYPNDQFGQQGGTPPPGEQQGGFPPQPAQAGGFPPPGPAPQPVRRGGGKSRLIRILILVVVLGGLVAAGIYFNRDAATNAKVGDCVHQEGTDSIKVVKCDDAGADFKVVGRVEDKRQSETESACSQYPDYESAYWEGKSGKEGLVLCLARVAK